MGPKPLTRCVDGLGEAEVAITNGMVVRYEPIVNMERLCDCCAMKHILIDVSECQTPDAFYMALLSKLGAPGWHGHNLDALWDSLTDGDINEITPPFCVEVRGRERVPAELASLLTRVQSLFEEAKADQAIDVCFKTD